MKKKALAFIVVVVAALVVISHHLLDSISAEYFQSGTVSRGVKVDVAFEYANIFLAFGLIPDHKAIAVAASYARNINDDFLSNIKRGSRSVRMLLSVSKKKEASHATQAAYEALAILVRMPLDVELAQSVNELAQKLAIAIRAQFDNATPLERFQVTEGLTMFAARSRADEALQLRADLNPPVDVNDGQWLAKLAAVRIGFSVCVQSDRDFPWALQSALNTAFPRPWLKNEALLGWDAPFMDVVTRTSRSPTCVEQARNFKLRITS